jgi:hypothetical protein
LHNISWQQHSLPVVRWHPLGRTGSHPASPCCDSWRAWGCRWGCYSGRAPAACFCGITKVCRVCRALRSCAPAWCATVWGPVAHEPLLAHIAVACLLFEHPCGAVVLPGCGCCPCSRPTLHHGQHGSGVGIILTGWHGRECSPSISEGKWARPAVAWDTCCRVGCVTFSTQLSADLPGISGVG